MRDRLRVVPHVACPETLLRTIVRTLGTPQPKTAYKRKTQILLTAPHGAGIDEPRDDPCTRSITNAMQRTLNASGTPCTAFVATKTRADGDKTECGLPRHRTSFKTFEVRDGSLHEQHTHVTSTASLPPTHLFNGVGSAVYIHGDTRQRQFAECLKRELDGTHFTVPVVQMSAVRVASTTGTETP